MAGAKSGVHVVQLKPIQVPANLVRGGKFLKWDDDSPSAAPVTLKVDPKGYILYWKDQMKAENSTSKQEVDCLDISLIRDVRTGKYARLPKDSKLRETIVMGDICPVESKLVTVIYGTDLINLNFLNFAAPSAEVAKEWTDALFGFATNLLAHNVCPLTFLEKAYTKLTMLTVDGKIPVKNIVRMFGQHKDDKKKIEKAMEAARLPSGKNENLNPNKLSFEDFLAFYRHLCGRREVEEIFNKLGAKKKPYLTAEQFRDFINSEQRDPRLNEILYPYTDTAKAQVLIRQFEPNHHLTQKDYQIPEGHMSFDGFLRYLLSEENALIPKEKLDISQDMDQPLSHYFINSSHNTYLTGHQLTGKSSVEIYRQALLTGCRCIELDCWDGKGADEEPIITHGYTMCTEIVFKEVIEAIAESAFKVSDFPVILSFENHCSPKQQAKMAAHCRNILGDMLLTDPLATNPLENGVKLPGPDQLKGKIIAKNKKRHARSKRNHKASDVRGSPAKPSSETSANPTTSLTTNELKPTVDSTTQPSNTLPTPNGAALASGDTTAGVPSSTGPTMDSKESVSSLAASDTASNDAASPELKTNCDVKPTADSNAFEDPVDEATCSEREQLVNNPCTSTVGASDSPPSVNAKVRSSSVEEGSVQTTVATSVPSLSVTTESVSIDEGDVSSNSDSSESEDEQDGLTEEEKKRRATEKEKGTAGHEAEAGMEMSALVNYIQPVHFHSFEHAEKRNRSYECVSFVETQASNLLKECPVEFVNFNKRQLSRIYPKGTRVDSSNYMPQIFWNAGCQLVALNFQTLDLAMQLNMGIFEYNGHSGYILKPDFMRRSDRQFDPFAESTVDGIIAGSVQIKVISGQFLSDRKVGTYIEVEMYGIPADTVRKKFKTRCVSGNGINPIYNEEPFKFNKIVLPTLATLRLAVFDEAGRQLGHRVLPVVGLRPGYRHICLRNEANQPLPLAMLFVHIKVGDFVPDAFADLAEALSNPIAYQSKLEKHTQQLLVLEEDFEVEKESGDDQASPSPAIKPGPLVTRHEKKAASFHSGSATTSGGNEGRVRAHTVLSHQDSDNNSQGSASRSKSATSSPQHSFSHSTPTHKALTPQVALAASSQGAVAENGSSPAKSLLASAPTPVSQKIYVIAFSRLKDPDLFAPVGLDQLRQSKAYQKCTFKLEKELESLRKKHERARQNLLELHELQEEKLIVSQVKLKSNLQKTHSKSVKRATRNSVRYGMPEEVTERNTQELDALVSTHELKHRELKQEQICGIATMCGEQQQQELDLHVRHLPQSHDTLMTQVDISADFHMRRLDELHEQDVLDLKKKLDAQNREEMKSLIKRAKDKSELDRLKREARSKHITLAVQERQKLQDILDRRKKEISDKHEQLTSQVQEETQKQEQSLRTKYSDAIQQIEEEKKVMIETVETRLFNGHDQSLAKPEKELKDGEESSQMIDKQADQLGQSGYVIEQSDVEFTQM